MTKARRTPEQRLEAVRRTLAAIDQAIVERDGDGDERMLVAIDNASKTLHDALSFGKKARTEGT